MWEIITIYISIVRVKLKKYECLRDHNKDKTSWLDMWNKEKKSPMLGNMDNVNETPGVV